MKAVTRPPFAAISRAAVAATLLLLRPLAQGAMPVLDEVRASGPSGAILFCAAYAVGTLLLVPTTPFAVLAGALYGPWGGGALLMVLSLGVDLVAFYLARLGRGPFARLGERFPGLARLDELARDIERDFEGRDLLLVGVLRGAVMVMADLARAMPVHLEMDWMAVSSYGSGTKSSGVVRILKDLDTDISGRDVLIVDEIIDTGLTLSWLVNNLSSRNPASVEIATLLRKPEALSMPVEPKYVGWDIPNEFVVGYGLDYRERYRNLRDIGTLAPHVYS